MEQNLVQTESSAKIEARYVILGACELWNDSVPTIEVYNALVRFGETVKSDDKYVDAIQQLIRQGYRVDLDWKQSYDDDKSNEFWEPSIYDVERRDYRLMVHKKTEYKGQINCTPFPLKTYPIGSLESIYKESYVIKVSFRYHSEFENTMRALYNEIKWGLVVIKAKKEPKVQQKKEVNVYDIIKQAALKDRFNSIHISKDNREKIRHQ